MSIDVNEAKSLQRNSKNKKLKPYPFPVCSPRLEKGSTYAHNKQV